MARFTSKLMRFGGRARLENEFFPTEEKAEKSFAKVVKVSDIRLDLQAEIAQKQLEKLLA